MRQLIAAMMIILLCTSTSFSNAQSQEEMGQTIQIYTRLHTFVGKPSWLLVIRDIDHNQNIPYLFDIKTGTNFWVVFTYSRNYLITVSNLQFSPYRHKPYQSKKINNFCGLESEGRIVKGKSLYITINGELTPNTNTFNCHVSAYTDSNFNIVKQNNDHS